jgi:hypothetical protein
MNLSLPESPLPRGGEGGLWPGAGVQGFKTQNFIRENLSPKEGIRCNNEFAL